MNRRSVIQTGIIGSGLLAMGGYISEPFWSRNFPPKKVNILSLQDHSALRPVIDFFLASQEERGKSALYSPDQILANMELVIAGFPEALQTETLQLFSVLKSRLLTGLTGGLWKPLTDSDPAEVATFLLNWRNSKLVLIQSLYHGLQELIMSAWFTNEEVWSDFGYPGPPVSFN